MKKFIRNSLVLCSSLTLALVGEACLNNKKEVVNALQITTLTSDSFTGGALTSGQYVLGSNIELTSAITVSNDSVVELDLGGYVLDLNEFNIMNDGQLTISDTSEGVTRYFTDEDNVVYDISGDSYLAEPGTDGCYETYRDTEHDGSIAITGGCITGGYGSDKAHLYSSMGGAIKNTGTLILESGNIIGNIGHGAIYNAGVFSMYGGSIIGNRGSGIGNVDYACGAIYNNSGATTYIEDGEISYNIGYYGGAINNNGILEIDDGTFTNNVADKHTQSSLMYGGKGGFVYNTATLNITDGTFNHNAANNYTNNKNPDGGHGGVIYNNGGEVTISNGEYCHNTALRGGVIYNETSSSVTLDNGNLSYNVYQQINSENAKGGAIYNNGTFTMNDGVVSHNELLISAGGSRNRMGGGIYNDGSGQFTINGGEISYNSAAAGGGIVCYGTLTMNDGLISNNTATMGAGIFEGSLYLFGGEISNNTATDGNLYITTDCVGGGIILFDGDSLTLGGDIVIKNNYNKASLDNVYIYDSTANLSISNEHPLTTGAEIGITTGSGAATFLNDANSNLLQYFKSDSEDYRIRKVLNDETYDYKTIRQYKVTYDATISGATNVPVAPVRYIAEDEINTDRYLEGEEFTISSLVPTIDGCVFDGWKIGDTLYQIGDTYTISTSDVTLVGQWHHTCGSITYTQPLDTTFTGGALTSGNYYLVEDISITSAITIADTETVNICLNGHVLDLNKFNIQNQGTLNIYDCDDTVRYFTDTKNIVYNTELNTYTIEDGQDGCYETYIGNTSETENAIAITGGVITGGWGSNSSNLSQTCGGAIQNTGILYIYGGNIVGNISNKGIITNTEDEANITINGGTIKGNRIYGFSTEGYGTIYNEETLTINNGDISYNTANRGGAIYNLGITNINNGTFSYNAANENANHSVYNGNAGGAICNIGGTLNIMDGTFNNNTALYSAGGAIFTNGGTITINDGTFDGNSAEWGGTIFNKGATITINDGTISNSTAILYSGKGAIGGAIYNWVSSTVNINGGTITGCSGYRGGGAIFTRSQVTMNGGTISNNNAHWGGAIYVSDDGTFTMNDGLITGNTSSAYGGAISVDGTVILLGGEISNNSIVCTDENAEYGDDYAGAGVDTWTNDAVIVGGTIVIKDNTSNGSTDNIGIEGNKTIKISEETPLAKGAVIGINLANGTGTFISNLNDDSVLEYFVSDKSSKKFVASYNEESGTYSFISVSIYAVIYDLNGGTGDAPVDNNKYDPAAEIAAIPSERDGFEKVNYKFIGWALTNDTTETITAYTIDIADADEDCIITLYAIWSEITFDYTVQSFTYDGTAKTFEVKDVTDSLTGFTSTSLVNAGTYDAVVTRAADGAYSSINRTITSGLVINKVGVNEPTITTSSFVYDGTEKEVTLTGVETYMSTTSSLKETNVGNYTVTYTLDGNHEWNADNDGILTWSITKGQATITVDQTAIVKSYGETISIPNATSNLGSVTCDKVAIDLQDVGTYTITYTVASTDNYDGDTKTISVTINKAKLDKPVANNIVFTYTGSEQTYTLATNDGYTITNSKGTNVGTQIVYVVLNDDTRYEWADGTTDNLEYTFTINKAQAIITVDQTAIVKTYDGNGVIIPEASSNLGTVTCDKTSADLVDAGTYTITYTVVGTANYEGDTKTISVTINKAKLDKPIANNTVFTYTGSEQTYTLTESTPYTISNNVQTNAGDYTVTVALKDTDNYEWSDGTTTDLAYTFTINKAQAAITVDQTTIVKTYGDEITIPEAITNFGEVECDNHLANVTPVGNYTIIYRVAGTANYEGDTKTVSVTVNKAKASEPTITTSSFVYDGTEKSVTLTGVQSYMIADTNNVTKATNAGLYTIKYTLDGNHEWANGSDGIITWTIKQNEVKPITEDESEKPVAKVEIEGGFDPSVTVEVEITLQDEVETSDLTIDYDNITDENAKLQPNEIIGVVFDVKLYHIVDGEKVELQPSDIAEGATIKVKMLIPDDVDVSKVTKIIHVHSENDIQVYEFDASKIDSDGYYEIVVDRLSEFAFVYKDYTNFNIWVSIIILAIVIAGFVVLAIIKKKNKGLAKISASNSDDSNEKDLSLTQSFDLASLTDSEVKASKESIANYLVDKYGEFVKVNRRRNYMANGRLPIPDTHYVVSGDSKKCFIFAYELKDGSCFFLVKCNEEVANEITKKHKNFTKSAFPKSKMHNWYSLIIDESYANFDEVMEVIDKAYNSNK